MDNELAVLQDDSLSELVDSDYFDFDTIEDTAKRAFLLAYAQFGTQVRAGAECGIQPSTHWRWQHSDPVYAKAFAYAEKIADQLDVDEVRNRARNIAKPSDLLLMFKVKAKHPEYKDNFRVEVNNNNLINTRNEFNFGDFTKLVDKD